MNKEEKIMQLKDGLIVSCQAEPEKGSQLYEPRDISRMAKEVLKAGACAVRICGIENIAQTRYLNPESIIIGITKSQYADNRVLITESIDDISRIFQAGADIVSLDMTDRLRPNGMLSLELYFTAKKLFQDKIFMADIATFEEANRAINIGHVDIVGTTLSGYTQNTEKKLKVHRWYEYEPDFDLLKKLTGRFNNTPIIAEGRIREPEQCYLAMKYGAWAVCIGSQATRPRMSTAWHLKAVKNGGYK